MFVYFYTEDISTYLKEHGIKPSYQRLKIFQYMMENNNHPTVDMIYRALCPEIPTLSKTTVYNTLNLFIERKITTMVVIEENETRYDLVMGSHGHFKCVNCGKLIDIDLIDINYSACEEIQGSDITEKHIYLKGICKECKNHKN
ncbi:MAG: Fur family transcriptional regulator [Fusobacterium sp.]|uniref:Fur family transcriptional regulator n=1 Tax=Fusobacterium sp. TaxID=68766 RepID=UPI0026DB7C70|nr:Fur family transcriptional regulator [Fusobacterium sp.]MDO4691146.1 Fur family transcriptional regulator [Fusobacterium sp.]